MLSTSVAKALQLYRCSAESGHLFQGTEGTQNFLQLCNDAFDVMNRRSPKEGITLEKWRSQKAVLFISNTAKTPCQLPVLLKILIRFRDALDASERVWKETKVQPFVALSSIPMMRMTVASTIDLVDYLLVQRNYKYILTGKFNQDCLEVNKSLPLIGAGCSLIDLSSIIW